MSDAERKWEREHPRWPGNTTVYRYLDSWASALEAARERALPSLLDPPIEPQALERAGAARRGRRVGAARGAPADDYRLASGERH
jgi:hypothetical protein